MKFTNELSLPEPIVNAIRGDDYDKGDCDFSVTELIKPVRIRSLQKKWDGHLTEDVSDRIYSLFGKAVHKVLETAADPRYSMVEKKYYVDFDGVRVGGRFDLMDYVLDTKDNILSDYKFTSRYVIGDGVKPEWEAQENMNSYLLHMNFVTVKKLQIIAIFRDWSKIQAERKEDYPKKQIAILPVRMWSKDQTREFIIERIKAHQAGEETPPICTPEERWRKPDKWALMHPNRKRAIKLYDTQEQAVRAKNNDTVYVEPRPGEDVRCLHYCPVNKYCSYYQGLMQEKI